MKKLIGCEDKIDTACVELWYDDGTMIAIDTIAVENEYMYQRLELDWLIYNKPIEYAELVLGGDIRGYLQGTNEQAAVSADVCVKKLNSEQNIIFYPYIPYVSVTGSRNIGRCGG